MVEQASVAQDTVRLVAQERLVRLLVVMRLLSEEDRAALVRRLEGERMMEGEPL